MNKIRNRASAVIIKGSKILLIHRIKEGVEYWLLPGGGIEDGETSEQAAEREVMEEVGLKVVAKLWYKDDPPWDSGTNTMHICKVIGSDEFIDLESQKNTKDNWYHVEWMEISNIKNLELYPASIKTTIFEL